MILSWIVSLGTLLYPWNGNLGAYSTWGTYSNGSSHQSQSLYVGFDRRNRDAIIFGYERVTEKTDRQSFTQTFYYGRGVAELTSHFRVAGFTGYAPFSDQKNFLLAGLQGTATWQPVTVGLWWARPFFGRQHNSERNWMFDQKQVEAGFGFRFGWFSLVGAIHLTDRSSDQLVYYTLATRGVFRKKLLFHLRYGTGKKQLDFDPEWMVMDLNEDIVRSSREVRLQYRFSPRIYSAVSYVNKEYDPVSAGRDEWAYTASYYTIGVKVRF